MIIQSIKKGLSDPTASIRAAAHTALISLARTLPNRLSDKECSILLKDLGDYRNPLQAIGDEPRMAALLGLGAFIASVPAQKIPYWLPNVLQSFARFGSVRSPDVAKVSQTLLPLFPAELRAENVARIQKNSTENLGSRSEIQVQF